MYPSPNPSTLNLAMMTVEKICHRLHGLRTPLVLQTSAHQCFSCKNIRLKQNITIPNMKHSLFS
eukprot:12907582-Prorocentrum_lima.AAC.1